MLIRGILKQKLFPACAYFFESEIQEILWFWGECFWMCFLLLKEAENTRGGGDVCFLASFISLGLKKVKTNREKRRREGERQCSAVGERHFEL